MSARSSTVRPVAVAQHPHDSALADAGGDFAAGLAQLLGHARRALRFLEGQLGVGVQMLVELEQAGVFLRHARLHQLPRRRRTLGAPANRRQAEQKD